MKYFNETETLCNNYIVDLSKIHRPLSVIVYHMFITHVFIHGYFYARLRFFVAFCVLITGFGLILHWLTVNWNSDLDTALLRPR